jgi:hypothetical protein
LFGLLQVGGGVVDLDVEADLAGAAILGGADATADALVGGLDEAVAGAVAGVLNLPVEQVGVER